MMWELEEAGPPKPEDRSVVKQPSRKQSKPPASPPEPPDTKSQMASDGKAPVPATEPKLAEWVPLVKSEEDLKAWQKTGPGTVTFDSGDVRVQNAAVTYPTPAADLAIRTQIQNEVNVKPNVRLLLRQTPAGSYAAVLENGSRLVVGVTEGEKWRELKSVPVDVPAGQPLVLEFSAVGNLLTVLLNGKPAIEVQDATHSYGSPGLAAGDGTTVFKDVQVNAAQGQRTRTGQDAGEAASLRTPYDCCRIVQPPWNLPRTRHRQPSPRSMQESQGAPSRLGQVPGRAGRDDEFDRHEVRAHPAGRVRHGIDGSGGRQAAGGSQSHEPAELVHRATARPRPPSIASGSPSRFTWGCAR